MKLQAALDTLSLGEAIVLSSRITDYVDIIELGTPLLLEEGMRSVRIFRQLFPDKEILADTKIADAGAFEAKKAFDAGADYITVLGISDLGTIEDCQKTADQVGKTLVVDMLCVENIKERILQLEAVGVKALAVHTGVDMQKKGRTPLEDLRIMKKFARNCQIFAAGGISKETIQEYQNAGADVAIVGGGIERASDPVASAKEICQIIR